MSTDSETILSRLVRMEEKLDSYLFRTHNVETRVESHDSRIRSLEQSTSKIMAVAGAVAFGVSAFGASLFGILK